MRRLLSAFLVAAMCLSLASCGSEGESNAIVAEKPPDAAVAT